MGNPDEPKEQASPINADVRGESPETETSPLPGVEIPSEATERVTGGGCLPSARGSAVTSEIGESPEGSPDSRKVTPGRTREDGEASSQDAELETEEASRKPVAVRHASLSRLREAPEAAILVPAAELRRQTRRDFLLFGAGTAAAAAAFWWVLPEGTQDRILTADRREWLDSMEARAGLGSKAKEKFLNRALTFDDDVAEALYSRNRRVRTYRKSDITALRNNYDGQTPDPDYIPDWTLELDGLASGKIEHFRIEDLTSKFRRHDQVTRLCCVEGWSAIAWWGGVRFADFLRAYPPAPGFRWAKLESSVNLDSDGDPDPYFVSIDLETARHAQTLLATHQNDLPLTVEHGAPMRLLVPMKLGLKNIKAVTKIVYSRDEPADYWNLQGYSKYDGL
ncbi:MAG: molybdopterin-dependent oxidoreductase [Stellaceae bacterium]